MTPRLLEAALFDLDGTLVDSLTDICTAVNRALRSNGLPALPEAVIASFVGDGVTALLQRVQAHLFDFVTCTTAQRDLVLAHDFHEHLMTDFGEHYCRGCLETTSLLPGARSLLDLLKGRGVRLGLITNKSRRFTSIILTGLGLEQVFDLVLAGDDLSERKPSVLPFRQALATCGARPQHTIVVGDSVNDALPAKKVGIPFFGVASSFADSSLLEDYDPLAVVKDLGQLEAILRARYTWGPSRSGSSS
ncbi:MAG: hypothetical protein A2284_09295 [Deltaproteobacteria bacterium RIFOXYA12_FULL_61_11]|nr:MAG: hypothetical protein A2284_09295 [Deltaproteobacteria bacterium RIFOXYA12_FULL_61_11]